MHSLIPDPTDPSVWFVGSVTEETYGIQVGDACLVNVHPEADCAGRACVVHNPSEHHMRTWPLNWRGDRSLMERICPCGIGHPDPDALAYEVAQGREWQGVHGCCGHCTDPRP